MSLLEKLQSHFEDSEAVQRGYITLESYQAALEMASSLEAANLVSHTVNGTVDFPSTWEIIEPILERYKLTQSRKRKYACEIAGYVIEQSRKKENNRSSHVI